MKKTAVYKCEKCGNVIESLWNGSVAVSCCGQDMKELVPNSVDAAKEKHVPVMSVRGIRLLSRSAVFPIQ